MKFLILIISILFFTSLSVKAENVSVDIGYPVVDEIEKRVFGVAYPQENIYKRLDQLEYRVYGNVTQAALIDRVDRLRDTILGKPAHEESDYAAEAAPNMIFSQAPKSQDEFSIVLYELEKKFLGTVYIAEPPNMRIARLERVIFQESSDSYPMDERLQRLCAYAQAKESGTYYEDQSKLRQYANMANGVRVISILFMILQAFL